MLFVLRKGVATHRTAGAAAGGLAAISRNLLVVLFHPGGGAVALSVLCVSCDLLGARKHNMPAPVSGMGGRQPHCLALPVPRQLIFLEKMPILPGREVMLMKLASVCYGAG